MVRTLSRMSDISVKLIVKRGFIVYIIRKRIRYVAVRYIAYDKNKGNCVMRTDVTEERRVRRRSKNGREEQEHKKCEIAKYDKDVLESTAGSLAVVTF